MGDKSISVIVPIYNAGKRLNRCIESLVKQSGKLEIILIDDGSMDCSWDICKRWAKRTSNIHIYKQKNAGVSVARNYGLSVATGQYILFVDSDDNLPEDTINKYMSYALDDVDLIIGSYREIGRGITKEVIRKKTTYEASDIIQRIDDFDKMISTPWGNMYQRHIIEQYGLRFDEGRPYGEDHIFNLRYCSHVKRCLVIPEIIYNYTMGGFASSIKYYKNINELNKDVLLEYAKYYCSIDDAFFKKKVRDQFVGSVLHYICCCKSFEIINKVGETMEIYGEFLNSKYVCKCYYTDDEIRAIEERDAMALVTVLRRENWCRLYLKKLKRLIVIWKYKLTRMGNHESRNCDII